MNFCFEDVDMYCCTDRVAMEKTITELATNSAISNRVHGLLLTGLESLRIELRKKSETLKSDARKMRETCEERRQVLNSSLHKLSHSCEVGFPMQHSTRCEELIHISREISIHKHGAESS